MSNHSFKVFSENTTEDELSNVLAGTNSPSEVIRNTASQILNSGAAFMVVEHGYLDRDFSDLYSKYYSRLFQRFPRVCDRYHFFSIDLSETIVSGDGEKIIQSLEEASSNGKYLGFLVIRPTLHSPLGRGVVVLHADETGQASHLLVRHEYKAHLFGAELKVVGTPITQQDSRVGACAQASIWMAARHLTERHGNVWASMADITQHATKQGDLVTSSQLPAGASFLTADSMIRAISAVDRKPLSYAPKPVRDNDGKIVSYDWGALKHPETVINRYVDSGIPVILGFGSWTNGDVGHAALAVGHIQKLIDEDAFHAANIDRPSRSIFCSHFLINDDQRGAYRHVPIDHMPKDQTGKDPLETPYNIKDHLQYLIVPLPDKVFLTAEEAEAVAWDTLRQYYLPIHSHFVDQQGEGPLAIIGHEISQRQNDIIARTYLTYGWKYKKRLLCGDAPNTVKSSILELRLPKYVWVTEFGFFQDLNHLDGDARAIFGHSVADATAGGHQHNRLVFHAPGLMATWEQNGRGYTPHYEQKLVRLDEHNNYRPKVRGQ